MTRLTRGMMSRMRGDQGTRKGLSLGESEKDNPWDDEAASPLAKGDQGRPLSPGRH